MCCSTAGYKNAYLAPENQATLGAGGGQTTYRSPLTKALTKIRLFFDAQTAASYSDVVAPVDITQRSGIESALNLGKLGMRGQLSAADVVAVVEKTLTDGCAT
jgi:hypothetical protein